MSDLKFKAAVQIAEGMEAAKCMSSNIKEQEEEQSENINPDSKWTFNVDKIITAPKCHFNDATQILVERRGT